MNVFRQWHVKNALIFKTCLQVSQPLFKYSVPEYFSSTEVKVVYPLRTLALHVLPYTKPYTCVESFLNMHTTM